MTGQLVDVETGEAVKLIAGYRVHPAADLFPLIEGAAFDEFVADIRENGQNEPVVLDADEQIIDGRNRARACELLDIAVRTRHHLGGNVLRFVVSHNLHRRHLTDSQRAMVAAHLTAGRGRGRVAAQIHQMGDFPPSAAEVRDLLSVAGTSLDRAKLIVAEGTVDLQRLADAGKVPLSTAARVATSMDPQAQDDYVAAVAAGADPVKTAPPASRPEPPKAPPRMGGNRRKHLAQIQALINTLDGAAAAFADVDSLDRSVTAEEAALLTGDLSKQIRSLNRINQLIKERTNP